MLIRPISISFTEPLGKNPLLPHAEAGEYPLYHVRCYLAARYLAKGVKRGAYVRRGKVGAHCSIRRFKRSLRLRKGVYVAGVGNKRALRLLCQQQRRHALLQLLYPFPRYGAYGYGRKFGANCVLKDPKIPYRETIRKTVKVQGRHKKQTGGHGQFGDVWIEFSPVTDGSTDIVFEDAVVGGVVPRNFIPSVEKGLRECMVHGVLAGYPMVSVKAKLYDGSYHPVDSSEMAFKTAARIAYKKGCADANPVLLEPIMHVEVIVPDDYMGDVMGDMNKRRGRIIGMEQCEGGQKIIAEAPLSEMFKYATDLRSMTQAWGRFTMTFARYEEVPADVAKKVIASADKVVDDDE